MLPDRVKEILRRPQDEVKKSKLQELAAAVRQEIEAVTCVYFVTSSEIEDLAVAVERCETESADEVGPYDPEVPKERQKIPIGARLMIKVDMTLPLKERRLKAAELVRSFDEGQAVHVKMRPLNTGRRPPLDTFARDLMHAPDQNVEEFFGDNVEEARDRLLLAPGLVTRTGHETPLHVRVNAWLRVEPASVPRRFGTRSSYPHRKYGPKIRFQTPLHRRL